MEKKIGMISKNIFKRRDDEVYISTYFINNF